MNPTSDPSFDNLVNDTMDFLTVTSFAVATAARSATDDEWNDYVALIMASASNLHRDDKLMLVGIIAAASASRRI